MFREDGEMKILEEKATIGVTLEYTVPPSNTMPPLRDIGKIQCPGILLEVLQ